MLILSLMIKLFYVAIQLRLDRKTRKTYQQIINSIKPFNSICFTPIHKILSLISFNIKYSLYMSYYKYCQFISAPNSNWWYESLMMLLVGFHLLRLSAPRVGPCWYLMGTQRCAFSVAIHILEQPPTGDQRDSYPLGFW